SAGGLLDLARGALDPATLSLRSGHAPGVEDDVATLSGQSVGHGRHCPPGYLSAATGTAYRNEPRQFGGVTSRAQHLVCRRREAWQRFCSGFLPSSGWGVGSGWCFIVTP